jgi:hypothetical protein
MAVKPKKPLFTIMVEKPRIQIGSQRHFEEKVRFLNSKKLSLREEDNG